jgi:hypothetical protein
MHKFQISLNRKNSMKIVKKAARSNQQGVYPSKRQISRLKGRKIDSQDHSAEEHRGRNPKKCKFGRFLGQRRLALCCQGQGAL